MNRSRIDIIIDILEVARAGTNKTGIVYKTNLNFKLAERYLDLLQNRGLVENRIDKYITTEKGKILLERARDVILQLTDPEEEQNRTLRIKSQNKDSLKIQVRYASF
ncbi:Winged helix-turn-helix [uncultured archaeon]|nr:Winged helix-turn-helix [uncultured archaeon]